MRVITSPETRHILDQKALKESIAYAAEMQKELHVCPEVSFEEKATTEIVRRECKKHPELTLIDIGMDTGAVAYLDAGQNETIALRADIDAVATEDGYHHLCGHDYHTASLLGAMHYLCAKKASLLYNVLFIFQPGEEATEGAKAMLSHGLLDKIPQVPVRLFGIHNRPELPIGQIAVHRGPLMAEKNDFTVTFTGKAGHGGAPHHCIDPITAAAQFIIGIQTVVGKNVDPLHAATCGIFSIVSGTEVNNPPDHALMTGTIRSLSHDAFIRMIERVETLAKTSAEAYECASDLQWIPLVPLLENGDGMYEHALLAAKLCLKEPFVKAYDPAVCETEPTLGSDDFAVFGEQIPSFYYWVGSGREGGSAPWHDPAFCIADGYLDVAVPLLVHAAKGGKEKHRPQERPARLIVS